jgi:hypothetical protein
MAFSIRVYEHPQFKLLHLLSEFYKGSLLTLFIDFLILNIVLIIELNILKAYFSQYHTPSDHHRERQYVSFLINIELGSLRFYVSFLHRSISIIVIPLISYNFC